MIDYPHKKIYGLLGAPRAGKDTVAKYLQESRNFVSLAFADKIKEEYGLNKADFESAKISGHIDELRKDLWDFSDSKKKDDPLYFISQVLDDANSCKESNIFGRHQPVWGITCLEANLRDRQKLPYFGSPTNLFLLTGGAKSTQKQSLFLYRKD